MSDQNTINLTFPDGTRKNFIAGIKGLDIAKSISKSLLKNAIAIEVDGIQKDLSDKIFSDAKINILTLESDKGQEIMRNTITAQVLAKAVKKLYPNSKLAIGPTIESGFYYDFYSEKPVSEEDLPKLEKEMHDIILKGASINKIYRTKKKLLSYLKKETKIIKLI